MSLTEELDKVATKRDGCGCNLAVNVFPALDEEERQELIEILKGTRYTAVDIRNVLNKRGLDVKEGTIRRFRQGHCSCEH